MCSLRWFAAIVDFEFSGFTSNLFSMWLKLGNQVSKTYKRILFQILQTCSQIFSYISFNYSPLIAVHLILVIAKIILCQMFFYSFLLNLSCIIAELILPLPVWEQLCSNDKHVFSAFIIHHVYDKSCDCSDPISEA